MLIVVGGEIVVGVGQGVGVGGVVLLSQGIPGQALPQQALGHIGAVHVADIGLEGGVVLGGIVLQLLDGVLHALGALLGEGDTVGLGGGSQGGIPLEGIHGALAQSLRIHGQAILAVHVGGGVVVVAHLGHGVVLAVDGGDHLALGEDAAVPHQQGDDQDGQDHAHHGVEDGLAPLLTGGLRLAALLFSGAVGGGRDTLFLFAGSTHYSCSVLSNIVLFLCFGDSMLHYTGNRSGLQVPIYPYLGGRRRILQKVHG